MFISRAHGEVYGIDGVGRSGPCDNGPHGGLYRVASKRDGEILLVRPDRIVTGGLYPDPVWLTELRLPLGADERVS